MKSFGKIRVLPVVMVAILGLAVLKVSALVIDVGYVFEYRMESSNSSNSSKPSWAQETFNFPGRSFADRADITGSVDKPKEQDSKPASPDAGKAETAAHPEQAQVVSHSERAILERLQSRRQELDARAREIEIRESLLKSAEKRAEGRVEELKAVESRITVAAQQKAEAEEARFKSIITMYEGMKPKDAAKVFDRLEMPVLFEIASQIAPRKMADILGQMSPDVAERLTVEMARRAGGNSAAADLPKIEGKMMAPPQKPN